MAKKKITAANVVDLLRARYTAPAWAFLEEVRNRTGYGRMERYADGLAMSLWPSRGLEVHGFEVKVTRSDVINELRKPGKADPIMQYCDRWWLVLGDKSLIQPGELPPTWGLMIVRGTRQLRAIIEAPKLQPAPLDVRFVASILRNFEQSYVPARLLTEAKLALREGIEARVKARIEENANSELAKMQRRAEHAERDRESLQQLVDDFNEKAGVYLAKYNVGDISEALRIVQGAGQGLLRRKLRQVLELSEGMTKDAEFALKWLDGRQEKTEGVKGVSCGGCNGKGQL